MAENNQVFVKEIPMFKTIACTQGFVLDCNPKISNWEKFQLESIASSSKTPADFLKQVKEKMPSVYKNLKNC